MVQTVEERKAKRRAYSVLNKEHIAEMSKLRYINLKDHISQQVKVYRQTPSGKKTHSISVWKQYGLINDDYPALYDEYINCTSCQVCLTDFKNSRDRCLDHDHTTGLFRWFLCQRCNTRDNWKKFIVI